MRHAFANANIHSDVNANRDAGCVGYANVDSDSDSYTHGHNCGKPDAYRYVRGRVYD